MRIQRAAASMRTGTRSANGNPSGETIEGRVERMDDFTVAIAMTDGTRRSFATDGGIPRVEIHDPLQGHRDLLRVYTDGDIHNVTAYLWTLR